LAGRVVRDLLGLFFELAKYDEESMTIPPMPLNPSPRPHVLHFLVVNHGLGSI
jgi:hypothetical protein